MPIPEPVANLCDSTPPQISFDEGSMSLVVFGNEDDGGSGTWDRIDWFRGHSLAKRSFLGDQVGKSSLEEYHGLSTVIVRF